MAHKQTPKGSATNKSKWEADPVSALHEFYHHKEGLTEPPKYAYSPVNGQWVCSLTLPDLPGKVQATGRNKKLAKRAVALKACPSVLA